MHSIFDVVYPHFCLFHHLGCIYFKNPFRCHVVLFPWKKKGFHMKSTGLLKYKTWLCMRFPHKHDGLLQFSDFLRNSKFKGQRLQRV